MAALLDSPLTLETPKSPRWQRLAAFARRHKLLAFSIVVFALLALVALIAPLVLPDPRALNPVLRLRAPSAEHWFGTDHLGRSVFVRTIYGTRVSLAVGTAVAIATCVLGLSIGLFAGFSRRWDGVIMRCMDGLMAIPGVLLAIALMALFGSDMRTVIAAITLPEVPRMARLVRSLTLTVRTQPYVQAAITHGARLPRLLLRHVLPNVVAPVMVQATYVFASAMILEAVLSFLGAGTPPDIPSWGNMLAEGRNYLGRAPWILAFPGVALALLVLLVNVSGDAWRDLLDPRLARAMGK
ncbi:ABC transporter permease [Variovorax sp. VNK109]|uniref:ABC transporter permease n=1 Tax=Variovorax sp. VNK109 TaxID=3400919 RepID=UPI003C09CF1E